MLVALSKISSSQAAPTEVKKKGKAKYFLDYSASHPYSILSYNANDMVLASHSNASHMTEPKARSRSGGKKSRRTTQQTQQTMEQS